MAHQTDPKRDLIFTGKLEKKVIFRFRDFTVFVTRTIEKQKICNKDYQNCNAWILIWQDKICQMGD